MFLVVTGGSGSGKSAYAEKRVASFRSHLKRYYLATMENCDEESEKRIQRHRAMRADKGFETIESPRDIHRISLPEKGVILLECMSNLVANEMFLPDGKMEDSDITEKKILNGIRSLLDHCEHLVVVTNEVNSDGNDYDPWTMAYLKCIGHVNQSMAQLADEVVEVVYTIPVFQKERRKNEPII